MSLPKLERDPRGKYRVRWTDETGVRRCRSLKTGKRTEAERLYRKFLAEDRERADATSMTVEQAWAFVRSIAEEKYATKLAVVNLEIAFRPVLSKYRRLPVDSFRPSMLLEIREDMIQAGLTASTINDRVNRIKRCFKWLSSREKVPDSVYAQLTRIEAIKPHEAKKQKGPVTVVPMEDVDATKVFLKSVVCGMVDLQLITGMRPGEVCQITPDMVDMTDEIWLYQPTQHKTKHMGKGRRIMLGPKAQDVLSPWLREPALPAFRVADALREGGTPGRSQGESRAFNTVTYGQAIRRAALKAGVPIWGPNRLRHNAATRLRTSVGLEMAKSVLGHARIETTQIYAESELENMLKVAREHG